MWERRDGQRCAFCDEPADDAVLGPLLGPVGDTDYFVHRPCALWSPEVRFAAARRRRHRPQQGGGDALCPALA